MKPEESSKLLLSTHDELKVEIPLRSELTVPGPEYSSKNTLSDRSRMVQLNQFECSTVNSYSIAGPGIGTKSSYSQ